MKRVFLVCVLCVWGVGIEGMRESATKYNPSSTNSVYSFVPFYVKNGEPTLIFGQHKYKDGSNILSGYFDVFNKDFRRSMVSSGFGIEVQKFLSSLFPGFSYARVEFGSNRWNYLQLYIIKLNSKQDLQKEPFARGTDLLIKPQAVVEVSFSRFSTLQDCTGGTTSICKIGQTPYSFLDGFINPFGTLATTGKGGLFSEIAFNDLKDKIAELLKGEIVPPVAPVTPQKKPVTVEQALEAFAKSLGELANKI